MSLLSKLRELVAEIKDSRDSNEDEAEAENKVKKEAREVDFDNLKDFNKKLDENIKEIKEKRDKIKESIKIKYNQFEQDVEEKIIVLKKVDVDKIRERDNLKRFVREGIDGYIDSINILKENFNEIRDIDSAEYIKKTEESVIRFEKNSRVAFEKATILIGKEMAGAKTTLHDFFRNIAHLIEENPKFSKEIKIIEETRELLEELDKIKIEKMDSEKAEELIEQKLKDIKEEKKDIEKEIVRFEKSEEYKKSLEEKEKIKHEINSLENEIMSLKKKIDFKLLIKHFYGDVKKTNIVKEYDEHFKQKVESDDNLEIINIVKGVNNLDLERLREIKKKVIELKNKKTDDREKQLEELKEKEKRAEYEIKEAENQLDKMIKFKSKIDERVEDIKKKIIYL